MGEALPEKIRVTSADNSLINIPLEDLKQLDKECDDFLRFKLEKYKD